MNYNPTPRTEFTKDTTNVAKHREVVQNPDVRRGIEVALAEVTRRLADGAPPDMGASASAHLRCLGAHDFVEIFYNLVEDASQPRKPDTGNLPGNVRQMKGN